MKKILTAAALCAAVFSLQATAQTRTAAPASAPPSASAPAPSSAPAGPVKLGTMNFEASVLYCNEGQRDFGELQKKFQPRRDKLEAQNAEIQQMQKQLQTAGEKLSEDERATRVRNIEARQKELQRASEDFQNDAQTEQQAAFQKIAAKVADYVQTYAQDNGYTAILEVGSQTTSVIYAVPSVDITRAVIAGYNQKSGVPAPPPSAPGAGSPGAGTTTRKPAAPAK